MKEIESQGELSVLSQAAMQSSLVKLSRLRYIAELLLRSAALRFYGVRRFT